MKNLQEQRASCSLPFLNRKKEARSIKKKMMMIMREKYIHDGKQVQKICCRETRIRDESSSPEATKKTTTILMKEKRW
jgi:hypothetical protein